MYSAMLALHSWLRWAVILGAVIAVARAFVAMRARRWTAVDHRASVLFTIVFDLQVLTGILLYAFLSPITKAAVQQMGEAMRNAPLRYWAVEHPSAMIIALILAHVGRGLVRRASDARKGRIAFIFFTIALVLILGMTPWPGTMGNRPLLRLP